MRECMGIGEKEKLKYLRKTIKNLEKDTNFSYRNRESSKAYISSIKKEYDKNTKKTTEEWGKIYGAEAFLKALDVLEKAEKLYIKENRDGFIYTTNKASSEEILNIARRLSSNAHIMTFPHDFALNHKDAVKKINKMLENTRKRLVDTVYQRTSCYPTEHAILWSITGSSIALGVGLNIAAAVNHQMLMQYTGMSFDALFSVAYVGTVLIGITGLGIGAAVAHAYKETNQFQAIQDLLKEEKVQHQDR